MQLNFYIYIGTKIVQLSYNEHQKWI